MGKRAALTGERIIINTDDIVLNGRTGTVLYYVPKFQKPYLVLLDSCIEDWPNPYVQTIPSCIQVIGEVSANQYLRYVIDYTMYFDDQDYKLGLGINPYTYGMDLA